MIALLAICRKVIILDLTETDALHILAFAAAIFALGIIYWFSITREPFTAEHRVERAS
jgi:uncharacterized membrane protein (DUF373 family)